MKFTKEAQTTIIKTKTIKLHIIKPYIEEWESTCNYYRQYEIKLSSFLLSTQYKLISIQCQEMQEKHEKIDHAET